jgi:hypothetical protein
MQLMATEAPNTILLREVSNAGSVKYIHAGTVYRYLV